MTVSFSHPVVTAILLLEDGDRGVATRGSEDRGENTPLYDSLILCRDLNPMLIAAINLISAVGVALLGGNHPPLIGITVFDCQSDPRYQ